MTVGRIARDRYDKQARRAVSERGACPVCDGRLIEKTKHSARCGTCPRYYSDSGWMPDVSLDANDYGHLRGDVMWRPLDVPEFKYLDKPLAWVLLPRSFPIHERLLKDHDLID